MTRAVKNYCEHAMAAGLAVVGRTDPLLTALRQQAAGRMQRGRPLFPRTLDLPPGRKVFAQVVTARAAGWITSLGYEVGELLEPDAIWLDRTPYEPEGVEPGWSTRAAVGDVTWASGTTDYKRVQ